jgi:hypothetical protein
VEAGEIIVNKEEFMAKVHFFILQRREQLLVMVWTLQGTTYYQREDDKIDQIRIRLVLIYIFI